MFCFSGRGYQTFYINHTHAPCFRIFFLSITHQFLKFQKHSLEIWPHRSQISTSIFLTRDLPGVNKTQSILKGKEFSYQANRTASVCQVFMVIWMKKYHKVDVPWIHCQFAEFDVTDATSHSLLAVRTCVCADGCSWVSLCQCVFGSKGKVTDKYVTHYAVRSPHNTEMRPLHKMGLEGGKWTWV